MRVWAWVVQLGLVIRLFLDNEFVHGRAQSRWAVDQTQSRVN